MHHFLLLVDTKVKQEMIFFVSGENSFPTGTLEIVF